jgi:poly(A) polymerase
VRRGVPEGPDVARLLRQIESKWVAAGFPDGDPLDAIIREILA